MAAKKKKPQENWFVVYKNWDCSFYTQGPFRTEKRAITECKNLDFKTMYVTKATGQYAVDRKVRKVK